MAVKFLGTVPSNRQQKVAELIKQALIDVLRKGKMLDRRLIDTYITVSEVKVAPDLKSAKCFVLPFGESKLPKEELLEALDLSKGAIRHLVTQKINLKYSPELSFLYDESFDFASRIDSLMNANKSNED